MKKILILLFGVITNFNALAAERWDAHFKNDFLQSNELNDDDDLRYPRATNDTDFSTAISRIQKIARVSNAISLQQAIAKGSLQAKESVISELLNFGAVTPTVLRGINASELAEFVKVIEGFGKTLEVNQGITKVEERLIMLGEIYKKTNGELKVEEPKGYLDEANKFKNETDNVDWDRLDSLVDRFVKTLAVLPKLNAEKTRNAENSFTDLQSYLNSFLQKDYSDLVPQLKSDILRQSELFTSLIAPLENINELTQNSYHGNVDPPFINELQTQVKSLGNVIGKSSNHLEPLKKLKQVIVSRHHFRGNRKLAHTAGFPAGFSDLESVFGDLQDPWVQKMVKGQSEKLKETLRQLRSVVNEAHAVSNVLGSLSSESASAIQSIYSQVLKLSRVDSTFLSAASSLVSISTEAQTVPRPPGNIENFTQLYGNITEVANKLKAIDALLATVDSFKNEKSEDIEFIINLTSTHTKENEKILKDSQQFQDLFETFSNLSDSIAILKENSSIADPLGTVIQSYGEVKKYIDKLGPIEKTVGLLKDTPELAMAEELMKVLREARKIQIKSFDPVGKLIKDVTPKMEALEKVFKTKSPESASLTSLSDDVLYSSQAIGNSARVVIGIQKALKEKKVDLLNYDLTGTGVPSNLSTQLDTFYDEAGTFKDSLKIPQHLLSISDIFELTRNVSGIPIDFLSLSASIGESSSKKSELKADLDTLDTFGLNFTQHKVAIQDSKDSLNSMDLFFASFASKHSPLPPAAPHQQLGGTTRIPGSQNSTESGDQDAGSPIVTWLAGNWYYVFVLLGAGAGGTVLWLMFRKKPKMYYKFHVPIDIFEIVIINWRLQLLIFLLSWREISRWADAINLHFSSFYDGNSAVTIKVITDEVKKNAKFYRRLVPYAEKNRFEIKKPKNRKKIAGKGRLHGNSVILPTTGQVYWLTQTPQAQSKDKVANISLFWMGVVEQKGYYVVCFESTADGQPLPYLPLKEGKANYDDGLCIECTQIQTCAKQNVVVRSLTIKFPKKEDHKVKHLQYMVWPAKGLPRTTDDLITIYKAIERNAHPVFLHCNDGISKCGVFAHAVMHMQMLERYDGSLAFGTSLSELRQHRQMAVSNEQDYMFVTLLTFKLLEQAINRKRLKESTSKMVDDFNAAIKDILEGRATWTKAMLVSVDAPLPPPPPPPPPPRPPTTPPPPAASSVAADTSKTKTETSQASSKVVSAKTAEKERKRKEKLNKEMDDILARQIKEDKKWVKEVRSISRKKAKEAEKKEREKKEREKQKPKKNVIVQIIDRFKTYGKGADQEEDDDDLEVDVKVSTEEDDGNPVVAVEDQAPSPPTNEFGEQDAPPVPLDVLSSETNVEMPEVDAVPPPPPANLD